MNSQAGPASRGHVAALGTRFIAHAPRRRPVRQRRPPLDTEPAWTRAEIALFALHGAPVHRRPQARAARHLAPTPRPASSREMLGRPPEQARSSAPSCTTLVMDEIDHGVDPMPGAARPPRRAARGRPDARAGVELAVRVRRPRHWRPPASPTLSTRSSAADDVEHPKPAPDLYLAAAGRLQRRPGGSASRSRTRRTGVAAARAAGAFTIGVPSFPGVDARRPTWSAKSLEDRARHGRARPRAPAAKLRTLASCARRRDLKSFFKRRRPVLLEPRGHRLGGAAARAASPSASTCDPRPRVASTSCAPPIPTSASSSGGSGAPTSPPTASTTSCRRAAATSSGCS